MPEFKLQAILLVLGDVNGMFEVEGESGFSGQDNLLVVCEACACCSSTAASEGADGCPLTSAGDATDDGSEAGAAANETGTALALATFGTVDRSAFNGVSAPLGVDAVELDLEKGAAFEVAERLGVDDGTIGARTLGDDGLTVDDYIVRDCGAEGVAGLGDFGPQSFIEADMNLGTGGKIDDGRRRSGLRRRGA
jgi:hypothetical protein